MPHLKVALEVAPNGDLATSLNEAKEVVKAVKADYLFLKTITNEYLTIYKDSNVSDLIAIYLGMVERKKLQDELNELRK